MLPSNELTSCNAALVGLGCNDEGGGVGRKPKGEGGKVRLQRGGCQRDLQKEEECTENQSEKVIDATPIIVFKKLTVCWLRLPA